MTRQLKIPEVPVEEVDTWPAAKINSTLDRLEKLRRQVNDELIAAGRGHETYSETMEKTDPLAERYQTIALAERALHDEIAHRYGPRAPSRLPRGVRGFGPRRAPGSWE